MKTPEVSAEMLLQVRRDRAAIAEELAELELQGVRTHSCVGAELEKIGFRVFAIGKPAAG